MAFFSRRPRVLTAGGIVAIMLLFILYSILTYDPMEIAESASSKVIHLQSGYEKYSPEHLRRQREFTRKWERITSTELVPCKLPIYISETIEPMTCAGCLNAALAFAEALESRPRP